MTRRDVPGLIYLAHFDEPIGGEGRNGAQHYTGWALDLDRRIEEHRAGRGARIMTALKDRGIGFRVAKVEPGDRNRERQLKNHGAARRCPICIEERKQEVPEVKDTGKTVEAHPDPAMAKLGWQRTQPEGVWTKGDFSQPEIATEADVRALERYASTLRQPEVDHDLEMGA
jgi:predicted GIY-YIG superfamily endonuclease